MRGMSEVFVYLDRARMFRAHARAGMDFPVRNEMTGKSVLGMDATKVIRANLTTRNARAMVLVAEKFCNRGAG
jgi:hypothetical protein